MSQTKKEIYSIQKNSWPPYGRIGLLWNALGKHRFLYLAGLLALLFEVFFTFISPMIVKITIDSIIGTAPLVLRLPLNILIDLSAYDSWRPWLRSHLWVSGLAFASMILMQALFSFIASLCINISAEESAKRLRDRLYRHIQYLPYETLLRAQTGDWLQRCTSDVDTVRRFLAFEFVELFRTLALVSFAFPIMLSLSPHLTLWGSLVMPVIILFSFFFQRIVERLFLVADEREGILSGIVQENVTGIRVVRAFARQQYEIERFARANSSLRDQVYKLISWLAFYWGFSSFLGLLQIAFLLGASLHLFAGGTITLGLLVLFLTYEQQVLWPVRQFGRILADTGKTKVALGRIAELLVLAKEEDLVKDNVHHKIDWGKASIEFRNVSFTYPDGTEVLKDVSFTVNPGERLAIVGPTGSGKSTLVHLLLRFYEPSAGEILIGGRDLRSIPKEELRRNVSIVLQDSFLFGKTVKENIVIGQDAIDEKQLVKAAEVAAFHQVALGFQDGYETMVGERGVTLSGGQRQRLALARALLRDAPILVLDDSLSAVDTETDRLIRESIGEGNSTSIIIAHRLTTLAEADQILVLEAGRVTGLGNHETLAAQPGFYRRLAELQSAFSL
ncbi:MAG: ABC transporter ATP-binding protein/permease [Treponema sp.]|nr:ABC transporter ATP-binding protein/permease [Treponema sp.]